MSKKLVGILIVLSMLMVATAAFADDDNETWVETEDYGWVMAIDDGRINSTDVAAPIAIYYTYETVTTDDGIGEVPDGLQFWAIDSETNEGYLVFEANSSEITQLTGRDIESISQHGYTLNYSSGWFWVTAPADAEGKTYSYSWENDAF